MSRLPSHWRGPRARIKDGSERIGRFVSTGLIDTVGHDEHCIVRSWDDVIFYLLASVGPFTVELVHRGGSAGHSLEIIMPRLLEAANLGYSRRG